MHTFNIDYSQVGTTTIFKITGELDASTCITADYWLQKVIAMPVTAIAVDCEQMKYISSAGIGVLIACYHACEKKGITLSIHGVKPNVKNVFEILGLDKVLDIKPCLQQSLKSA